MRRTSLNTDFYTFLYYLLTPTNRVVVVADWEIEVLSTGEAHWTTGHHWLSNTTVQTKVVRVKRAHHR